MNTAVKQKKGTRIFVRNKEKRTVENGKNIVKILVLDTDTEGSFIMKCRF